MLKVWHSPESTESYRLEISTPSIRGVMLMQFLIVFMSSPHIVVIVRVISVIPHNILVDHLL